ncbi:MAG: divalent-cation tolerance protein CutA [Methylococcaceae bacterium]|jgi:periplasmic divalent cation tolerance protein|nr:divalent-cation tolerance protein CutA [Methylococcaceae bacterium]
MPTRYQIILCTCPDKDTAEKIAHLLVNDKVAACVNILSGITSMYLWHEQIESAQEYLLLIKANKTCYPAIEKTIKKHHPYELPEIIAVPIENGLPEYLHWIDSCHSYK